MKWTLVVPGALLPAALAPELVRAIQAPRLVQWLATARSGSECSTSERNAGAPHWSWLAKSFGLDADMPVTAPYAWQASGAPDPDSQGCWIAQCDPVHMAIARDHLVVTDLGDAPLLAEEAEHLFALANEVLCGSVPDVEREAANDAGRAVGRRSGLRFAARGKQWFLLAEQPLHLETAAVDAVLGRSVHERMPTGNDARRWRILANEIQMLWHASSVNAARELRDAPTANALWIHGGGRWQPLPPSTVTELRTDDAPADAAVLRGWIQAASAAPGQRPAHAAGDLISLCRSLFAPFAHQAWESWLDQLAALEDRIEQDLATARQLGAERFELVLCGVRQVRTLILPLRRPWWSWPRSAPHAQTRLLQRLLGEAAAPDADNENRA